MQNHEPKLSEQDFNMLDRQYAKVGDMKRLEGRFDTELKHLATKSDLHSLMYKTVGLIAVVVSVLLAIFEFVLQG